MQNLRDKLMKAGLVSEDQAKKAEELEAKKPKTERPREDSRTGAPDRGYPRGGQGRGPGPARPGQGRPFRGDDRPRRDAPPRREALPRREPPIPKLPPLPGSREHQRLVSRQQVELDRKLRERVVAAQVALEPGESTFYFVTRKQRLRRLELSADQHAKLESGELAVVERPDPGQIEHALVPAAVAEELLALSEKVVRFLNRGDKRVGFLSDDELKTRQEDETSGAAETREVEETKREDAVQAAEIAAEVQAEETAGTTLAVTRVGAEVSLTAAPDPKPE